MAGDFGEKRPVVSVLTSHWVSMLGAGLVTIAGCTWLFLLPVHAAGKASNPYLGILFFFAVPAVFFAGLGLIPIGAWLARRRIQAGLAEMQDRRTTLRRLAFFFVTMTVVNVVIGSQVTYRAVNQMESNQFCGQTCHVMKPQFISNQRSVHRNVGCVECHVVPGAAGFMAAKMNGTKQMVEVMLNNYPRPVPAALASGKLAPSAETCEECHARTFDSGSQVRVISRFKDDEANSPMRTVLTMHIGGPQSGGIHGAHMGPGVEIRYRTADPKRQMIPIVEYRNRNSNETRTYTVAGAKDSGPEFVMQCADCHNRQGHAFQQPDEAIDTAMAAGQIPTGLPFAHKTGVAILNGKYADDEDAARKIPAAFAAFYRDKYPEVWSKRSPDIDRTGHLLISLYQGNIFSDYGVKWGSYPTNLGHADNFGCFRCHDESHAAPQKKTITQDCSSCHEAVAMDEPAPAVLKTLGIESKLTGFLKQ
jgi:nitrate/TMAO reductase-like tetraheme cytochrome c subunit